MSDTIRQIAFDEIGEVLMDYMERRERELRRQEQENIRQAQIRTGPKIGHNEPCPCGSGKKYKKCHGRPG